MTVHIPVLLKEAIAGLNLKPGMVVVDATLGGGGHSESILKRTLPGGKLIAFDRDAKAIDRFKQKIGTDLPASSRENIELVQASFGAIGVELRSRVIASADAILADLGLSSDQLEDSTRGFSFQADGPLDMRMDQSQEITAASVVNRYSPEDIETILREYGDERFARTIARAIAAAREAKPLTRTNELVSVIEKSVPVGYRHGKIHCATRTLQAIRIEVNREYDELKRFLAGAIPLLARHGRLAVITFHSGEDRIVKQFFQSEARGCICPPKIPVCRCDHKAAVEIITKKPIVAGKQEITENPRARSAKLRIVEKH